MYLRIFIRELTQIDANNQQDELRFFVFICGLD